MRAAIFIDGACLINLTKQMRITPNYTQLADYLLAPLRKDVPLDLLRCYYYYCAPWMSPEPTEDELRRMEAHGNFVKEITSLDRWQLKLGKLQKRREGNKEYFEQKRVDVLLSIDMVRHAAAGHIQHAVLVAGDSDFIPAVAAAKDSGVTLTLWCAKDQSVHNDLKDQADEVHYFDWRVFPRKKGDEAADAKAQNPRSLEPSARNGAQGAGREGGNANAQPQAQLPSSQPQAALPLPQQPPVQGPSQRPAEGGGGSRRRRGGRGRRRGGGGGAPAVTGAPGVNAPAVAGQESSAPVASSTGPRQAAAAPSQTPPRIPSSQVPARSVAAPASEPMRIEKAANLVAPKPSISEAFSSEARPLTGHQAVEKPTSAPRMPKGERQEKAPVGAPAGERAVREKNTAATKAEAAPKPARKATARGPAKTKAAAGKDGPTVEKTSTAADKKKTVSRAKRRDPSES